jgi:predicted acetyltransferase
MVTDNAMPANPASLAVNVEIIPARVEQAPILANMFELYAYDFSEFLDLRLGADGRFGYNYLPNYWTAPGHYPFFILVNGSFAGFVFVRKSPNFTDDLQVWDMAEFFILRSFRRAGLGTTVAISVWQQFPGQWQVRVLQRNLQAGQFWSRAINTFLGTNITPVAVSKDGEDWFVYSFAAAA